MTCELDCRYTKCGEECRDTSCGQRGVSEISTDFVFCRLRKFEQHVKYKIDIKRTLKELLIQRSCEQLRSFYICQNLSPCTQQEKDTKIMNLRKRSQLVENWRNKKKMMKKIKIRSSRKSKNVYHLFHVKTPPPPPY